MSVGLNRGKGKFERFVLWTYRGVCADPIIRAINLSDEIRASFLSFTKQGRAQDWCLDAPLVGFFGEIVLFKEQQLELTQFFKNPMLSAPVVRISSVSTSSGEAQSHDIAGSGVSVRKTKYTPVAVLNVVLPKLDDDPPGLQLVGIAARRT